MPSSRQHSEPDRDHHSRATSDFNTDLPPSSPSFDDDSPSGAYATLSRLQSKPSLSTLRSGSSSNFLFSSAPTEPVHRTDMPVATTLRNATTWHETLSKASKLDAHVRRIIFQAGLDYETRPMVVLASCFLPDPREVDYDALLDRIMDALDLFVENDYTVIYFASGGQHKPGWSWIWRAYRRLDRRFRKNLKKLYIVHPTFFTRSLLQFVHTGAYFISPKFSKKVEQLNTLSSLAQYVPITQIDIPPEVLQWNLRFESSINLSDATPAGGDENKVFGIDLPVLMGEYGESGGVPRVVRDCVEAILGDFDGIRPVEVEGIFRRSPSSALLKSAEESYDRGHPVSLEQYRDPHIPAVLLKVFLRKLPSPIFPVGVYGLIRACPPPPLDGNAEQARETIDYLRNRLLPAIEPACNGVLLSYVLEALHKVSLHSATNRMDAANLATVIAPNLVCSGNAMKDMLICRVAGITSMANTPSSSVQSSPSPHARKSSLSSGDTTLGSILRICIERYYEIFDEQPFAMQVNNVQSLVDHHPHVYRGSAAGVDGSPSVLVRDEARVRARAHRRGESITSEVSQASLNTSGGVVGLGGSGGNGGGEDDGDDRSSHATTNRSLASRDAYRPTPNFRGATIGRNSSGSLRLTKGRLGSNANLRSSFTPTSSNLATSSGTDTEGLTAQLSGVTLTGMTAVGTFSSPGGSRVRSSSVEGGEGSVPVSPLLRTAFGVSATQQLGDEVAASTAAAFTNEQQQSGAEVASSTQHLQEAASDIACIATTPVGGVARSKSMRRELSEVAEADDVEP
uniref:Rho-GAP domain-containing protein n=1 Tax=Kalmanozyma brasiliensis (strain GHG001) TaxID=1365824 RepID=V5EEG3_KALBG